MSVNPRHNKFTDGNIRIDYVSLYRVWSGLSRYQRDILAFGESTKASKIKINPQSLQEIKDKLTSHQEAILKTDFFHKLKNMKCSKATNRKIMLDLQDQIESGLIKSVKEFKYDGTLSDEARRRIYIKSFKVRHNGQDYLYDMYNVPEEISRWRVWKIAQMYNSVKCFYTGEDCVIATKRSHWSVSEEHLIPQVSGGMRRRKNNVIAANWINNVLGGAPIHVKVDIKRALDKIVCHPSLSMIERKKVYEKVVNYVLNQYKVHGVFPWNMPPKRLADKADMIRNVLKIHREAEKIFIDSILGDSRNIANTVKEIIDGMECAYYEIV